MSNNFCRLGLKLGYSVIVVGVAIALDVGFARAAEISSTSIINSLTPKPLTRTLSAAPVDTAKAAEDEIFVNSVRNRATRSLSIGEREKIATIARDKPSIDLEINFEYNSARIGKAATRQVNELGTALIDPALKGNTFILAGYADKSGEESYNQTLSERRADSVKQYLVEKFQIPAGTLVTVGYGSTHFKNDRDPYAAENRRVAVSNVADKVSNNR
jgi:outer membrane protein OmpA-like peptidoglycan-associated protein